MSIEVCCLIFTLMSANLSDLRQTAYFTGHQVGQEGAHLWPAPLKPLVKRGMNGLSARGEIVSGILATAGAVHLQSRNTVASNLVMLGWTAGHTWAARRNDRRYPSVGYAIMAPTLTVRW